jgi:hypothetical protein
MVAAAIILYGIACICFLLVAGNVAARINLMGLGLFCCALYWWLQIVVPRVQ